MIRRFWRNHVYRFFILASLAYATWFAIYQWYIIPFTKIDEKLISNIVFLSAKTLEIFGFDVFYSVKDLNYQIVGIDGAHPVWIGGPCNALPLMSIFVIFLLFFPGPIKHKFWFIPIGCISIHLVNIIRVCSLVYIQFRAPEYLDFNHTYTFTFLVYFFIFFLWLYWANHFTIKNSTPIFNSANEQ